MEKEKSNYLSILYINNSSRVSIYLQVLFFTKSLSAFRKIFHQFDWPTIFQRIDGEYVRQRSREPKLLSRHIQSVGNKKRRDRSPVNAANNWIAHSGYAQFQSDLAVGWSDQGQPRVGPISGCTNRDSKPSQKESLYPISGQRNSRTFFDLLPRNFSGRSTIVSVHSTIVSTHQRFLPN